MGDQIMQGKKANPAGKGNKRVFSHSLISGSLLPSSEEMITVGLKAEQSGRGKSLSAATLSEGDFPRKVTSVWIELHASKLEIHSC